jgi:cytochrome c oxidase cbb3-type subunit 3
VCHGIQGEGGIGPNLTDEYWLHGGSSADIARTIIYGIPEKGMISWRHQLTPTEVGQIVAYINSIAGTEPEQAKAPQGKKQ